MVNLDSDQNENTGKTFSATLIIQEEKINLFAEYIASLYTTDGENGLYYHDADLTNGANDNSYRYAGSNPNNYVCFGSDEETCPADNLYRIIGVFGNQVKLIKNTYYTTTEWDSENDNTWDASIKPNIYNTLNTTYYNTLTNPWQNLIAETTWQVGGMTYSNTNTAKQYFDEEVGTKQNGYEETMKIGLMYISDYGYAASPEYWSYNLSSFDSAKNYNWLYSGVNEWTISANANSQIEVINITSSGNISHNNSGYIETYQTNSDGTTSVRRNSIRYAIRPTFYIHSNIKIIGGNGTNTNPFILKIEN